MWLYGLQLVAAARKTNQDAQRACEFVAVSLNIPHICSLSWSTVVCFAFFLPSNAVFHFNDHEDKEENPNPSPPDQ